MTPPPSADYRALVRRAVLPVLVSLLSSCDVVSDVEARAGYARLSLGGDVALGPSPGGSGGSAQVAVDDELGLGAAGSPVLGLEVASAAGRFDVSVLRYEDAGEGVLRSAFGDIPAGTPVRTEAALDNVRAIWAVDLLQLGPLRVSPGLGVDWFDVDTRVSSITPISVFERFHVTAPVPMVFVDTELDLGPVAAEAEIGGMSLSLGDVDGTFWDVDARVVLRPLSAVELFAGYRFVSIDARGDSEGQRYDADLALQGWALGGSVRF